MSLLLKLKDFFILLKDIKDNYRLWRKQKLIFSSALIVKINLWAALTELPMLPKFVNMEAMESAKNAELVLDQGMF